MFAWREIYYVQYCYNQKNNSSFCVQYPSCRLEPSCWNTITILTSPAFFHILTQKLFANQLVMNILQRLSNKRRILNTSSSKNHEQTTFLRSDWETPMDRVSFSKQTSSIKSSQNTTKWQKQNFFGWTQLIFTALIDPEKIN